MIEIDICIITFNRPNGLQTLLNSINHLQFAKVTKPNLRIVVVDNDPEGSAKNICHAFSKTIQFPLDYYIESKRGIPQARNRAIREARPQTDFIVFIDDDELPAPQWLDELLFIQSQRDAPMVYGPVLPRLDDAPAWFVRGGWLTPKRYLDGALIDNAATGNILIRRDVLIHLGDLPFNQEMALTGGSDTHFFVRAQHAGFQIYWADNALVYEWQPRSRFTARWILMRAFRDAYNELYLDTISQLQLMARIKRTLLGLGRVLAGIFLLPLFALLALFKGRHFLLKPVRIVFRGLGMLTSALKIAKYEEYRSRKKNE